MTTNTRFGHGLGLIHPESYDGGCGTSIVSLESSPKTSRSKSFRAQGSTDSPALDKARQMTAYSLFSRLSSVSVLVLAIYSTTFSCAWLLVATIKPHWGTFVSNNGSLSPSSASNLAAGIAKTIEISFLTVFVVCLGQYLTIRAKENGIRSSDFQLKTLMLSPGSVFIHAGFFRVIRRRGMIGLGCIVAFIVTAFYTTASNALVAPRPTLANPVLMQLHSSVRTSMANPFYISQNCPNPYGTMEDTDDCIITEHAGAGMHNFIQYLSQWQPSVNVTQVYNNESNRPVPQGLFGNDLPIEGLWMPSLNSIDATAKYGRLIISSMVAMPHAGVVNVASLDNNNLGGLGVKQDSDQLTIEAFAVSPVVNVTCATIQEEELLPLIYLNWTHTDTVLTPLEYLNTEKNASWRQNKTSFDDVFGFQSPDGDGSYRDMLYTLFKSKSQAVEEYTLCGLSLTLIGGCSSIFSTNVTGSRLQLNCDENNPIGFPGTPILSSTPSDWVDTANTWALAIALGGGTTNAMTALGSMLSQLIPTSTEYDPWRPSLVDALAILSICTLISSTLDTPFDAVWPYSTTQAPNNILPDPILQPFQARIQFSDYSSGSADPWENIFLVVLLSAVVLNIICLCYLIILSCGRPAISRHGGLRRVPPKKMQRDITDLDELFTTAISSPRVDMTGDDERERLLKNRDAEWSYSDGVFVPFSTSYDDASRSPGKERMLGMELRSLADDSSPYISTTYDFERSNASFLDDEEHMLR